MSSGSSITFPQNPNRPVLVGRGNRTPVPTAGMINHNAQVDKNKKKRERANDTREKNKQSQSTVHPSPAPLASPQLAQQLVPNTPAVASQQASRHYSQTPSSARRPLINLNQQQSSPLLHHPTSSPFSAMSMRPPAQPALPVPQNYRPDYPDYSGSGAVPQTQQTQSVDAAQFAALLSRMSEEQVQHLAAGYSNSFSVSPGSAEGGEYNADYNGSSVGLDSFHDAQEFSQNPNGDISGSDADNDKPWNEALDDHPAEEDDLHANAQSSLEVTMHDVNVQRKQHARRHKRKAVDVSDVESDTSEAVAAHRRARRAHGTAPKRPATKHQRKKRPNRRQKSRSIKDLSPHRQRLVAAAFPFLQQLIATYIPWPTASSSNDPEDQFDDEFLEILNEAWAQAIASLGLDPSDVEDRTDEEDQLIIARISQLRSAVVTAADALVPAAYGFTDPHDADDATPETVAAGRETNRVLVDNLHGAWMYSNPKDITDLSTACRHAVFQKVLNAAFFRKTGLNKRAHYFKSMDVLPTETMALIMAAVACSIDRWKTGEYVVKSAPFDAEVYRDVHLQSRTFLEHWISEYESDVYPVNIAAVHLREMLTKARLAASVTEEEPQAKARFPMHVFSNVSRQ
ncbi:hypothetical protein C8R43DRAFT_1129870 [Mycena crocata]|nr:hypothetical protein C8R43DRAFT_1129870 [Mycena crocata]